MVEKMMYEKKEERNHMLRSTFIVILGIILCIGDIWLGISVGSSVSTIKNLIVVFLTIISFIGNGCIIGMMIMKSEECMKKNLKNFQLCTQIEQFMNYLGAREIQVKLKCLTADMTPEFEKAILNPKLTYYVRKKDPSNIEFVIYKKNKEISCWDTEYKFVFKYFEPIYEAQKEDE